MKYEPIFGDQALLEDAGTFTGLDVFTRNVDTGLYGCCRHEDLTYDYLRKNPVLAMRRIIQEPKRWTVEDKKAGRLPEVGCEYIGRDVLLTCVFVDKNRDVWGKSRDKLMYCHAYSEIKPIETPEEKAARLREEWCIKALSSASILSGMQEYELKRLGGYIGDIYDALLSGELTMPNKDGE